MTSNQNVSYNMIHTYNFHAAIIVTVSLLTIYFDRLTVKKANDPGHNISTSADLTHNCNIYILGFLIDINKNKLKESK